MDNDSTKMLLGHRGGIIVAGLAVLGLAAAFAWTPHASAGERDVQLVLRAAMAHSIENAAPGKRQCMRLAMPNDTFERWRAYRRSGGELTLGLANPEDYRWRPAKAGTPLPRALRAALKQAIVEWGPRRQRTIPAAWVLGGLAVTEAPDAARDCFVHVYSDPLVLPRGWAFVEDDIACGPMCGAGRTLALRREGDRWVVAAAADSWQVGFERLLAEPLPDPSSDVFNDQ